MPMHGSMRSIRPRRRAAIMFIAALLVLAAIPAVARATDRGATTVRGTQLAAGTCADGGYAMTGSLTGCWWIDSFESKSDPDRATFVATGTEHFTGCLGTTCGTFFTTYKFTSKTDGPWGAGSPEIHGRCHHPVVSGTGGFTGVRGEISFRDVVDVSPPYYPYWGNLRLATGRIRTVLLNSGQRTTAEAAPAVASTC